MRLLFPVSVVVWCLVGSHASGQSEGWSVSFDEARAEAVSGGLPLLIHFKAAWCGPCRQMDSQVFGHSEVQQALRRGLVSVQVDVSREETIASTFHASTVPRDVVLYPDGTVETLNVGFLPRSAYLAMLSRVAEKGSGARRSTSPPATVRDSRPESQPQPEEVRPEEVRPGAPSENPAATTAGTLLGLEGFCPIRLHTNRAWVRGNAEIQAEYRGIVYYFADASARDEFLSDPDRYAPRNLGCDPVVLTDSQRAVTGRIQYGAFFDNQLFLFSSMENKAEFRRNPLRFTRIRHAVKPAEIEGTRFR